MKTPLEATLLILSYEQLRLTPYKDAVGITTWGWGHARQHGEEVPAEVTREAANRIFMRDLQAVEAGVTQALAGVTILDHRFGALVSFAFNVGVGALKDSTLLRMARQADYIGAADQFQRWVYGTVNGKKVLLRGLVERRVSEARLWRG